MGCFASSATCSRARLARLGLIGWLLLATLLATSLAASGQTSSLPSLPGLGKLSDTSPPASAASAASGASAEPLTDEHERARLNTELAEVRRWSEQLADSGTLATVPAGITSDELAQAIRKLGQWTFAIEGQLRAMAGIESARAELDVARTQNTAWTGPGGKPPYSILTVDDWAREAEASRTRIASMQAENVIAEREVGRRRESAKVSAAAVRRAEEVLRKARDAEIAAAAWREQAARWAAAAESATLAAIARDRQRNLDKLAVEQAQLDLLTRKLNAVVRQVSFSAEDLAQVRRIEQTRQARLEEEASQATAAVKQREREFDAATRALQQLRVGPHMASQEQLDLAEARLLWLRTALETARRDVETLANLTSLSVASLEMWAWRFDALNAPNADRRREATAALRKSIDDIRVWKTFASGEVSVVQSELAQQSIRQEPSGLSAQIVQYELATTDSLRQRATRVQQLEDRIDRIDLTLRRWLKEIGGEVQQLPWRERAALLWSQASNLGRSIWRFEIFTVEDTVDLQGQKVTISHGVTVGKSVGAALLLVFGYLIAARLARRVERTLINRFGVGPAQAHTVQRWALTLVTFLLLLLTLNVVQIPLTVFAFMGGALAIGVGFGTQTIIKNFISGLILLMERQIRVGDIVEVDGTTGTVAEVNLRSSTIKGFDGIAAIVPNSTLLEGKVNNWTMGDPHLRRIVRVGVAYGSPTDQVSQRMLACAQRHDLVLKQPEPQVLFEEFGDSTLTFALYFWIDVQARTSGQVVMSDLRHMIEKSFAEGGISMAFPQRDLHLDSLRPLQVELTRRVPGRARGATSNNERDQ